MRDLPAVEVACYGFSLFCFGFGFGRGSVDRRERRGVDFDLDVPDSWMDSYMNEKSDFES